MELREAFIEGENEPFREADVFGEVEIAGDGGFNLGTDAPFDHTANLITLQDPFSDTADGGIPIREAFVDDQMEMDSTELCQDSMHEMDEPIDIDDTDIDIEIPDIVIGDAFEESASGEQQYIPDFDIEGDVKLYEGSSLSCLQAVSLLLSWFSSSPGMSKRSLSSLLNLLHTHILPSGNVLPSSYRQAVKLLQPYLSPVKDYHCCVNDCIIYRDYSMGKFSKLTSCPICGEPRFKPDKKSPRKRFKFLSVATRVKHLFGNSTTSILMKSHTQNNAQPVGIHASPAWKEWYGEGGLFDGDARAISFALCADGLNPFAHEKTKYSMCPLFLIPLNFPDHIRKKAGAIFLTGIIPGRKEPKNMDPYVDLIVDDIISLNSLSVYDAHMGEEFKLKANILLHVLDYPGQNKLFKSQGAGAYSGCTYCCIRGEYSNILQKMVYLNHRAFLPSVDLLHKDGRNFPGADSSERPAPKTMEFINEANGKVAAATTDVNRKKIFQESGCKGPYSLIKLPSHDRYLNTPVEPMHLIKNIAEHIVKLLSGIEDSLKVRQEEKSRKRFRTAWVKSGHESEPLPQAPFSLSQQEMSVAKNRALSVVVPAGIDWKRRKLFDRKSLGYIKSIEWKHVLSSGILKYCIRGLVGEKQRKALFELCDVVAALLAYDVAEEDVDSLEYRVHRVLSLLERDFPVSLHVIVFHLLHHLPMFIHRFGPAYSFWMYPMERFNSWIAARITNRRYPENTVLESYRLFELSFAMQLCGKLPQDTAVDIDLTDLYEPSEEPSSDSFSKHAFLTEEQHFHLDMYYRRVDSDYKNLVTCYESEKKKSDHSSSLEDFPPLSRWQPENVPCSLSPCQLELRQGPTDFILALSICVIRDKYGRKVKYSTESADDPISSCSSSYVALNSFGGSSCAQELERVVGRIQMIFKHRFNEHERLFAYLHCFDRPECDMESGLHTVSLNSSSSTHMVVPLSDLSRPIIHAVDSHDPNKLWLLNLKHL